MTLPVVFRAAAKTEYDGAVDWYEDRQSGQGNAFVTAVRRVLVEIADRPMRFMIARGDVRQVLVSGFPFSILYRIKRDRVVIIAVFHTSRNPSIWQKRI